MDKRLQKHLFALLSITIVFWGSVATGQDEPSDIATSTVTNTPSLTITEIGENDDVGRAVKVLPDGTVMVVGSTDNGKDDDFAILQYSSNQATYGQQDWGRKTRYYLISTLEITKINRNGAVSGGQIVLRAGPSSPTISKRGVCYSVSPFPSYNETETTATTTSTDTTDNQTPTPPTDDTSQFPAHTSQTSYNYETVRHGCTSDGSGTGIYGSDINKVTPGTTYYVRAYAVLSSQGGTTTTTTNSTTNDTTTTSSSSTDGEVIYGNQLVFTTEDACFIATAAYGSVLNKYVVLLRQFRDTYLKTNALGRGFIQLYYQYSPSLAEIISKNSGLRFIVRVLLMPLIAVSYFLLKTGWIVKLMVSMLLLFSTIVMVRRLHKIKLLERKYVRN